MINLSIANDIARIQIDNPSKMNALSTALMEELSDKIYDIDKKAKVVIISGIDKAFAAGVDISEIASKSYEEGHLSEFINSKWEALLNVRIPVIASVSGYALGGGFELVLMSDIVIASENAKFGFPEVNLGVMPGLGGTQLLTKTVGAKIASLYMMTGKFITSKEASEFGIVSKVVSANDLSQETNKIADDLLKKPKMSLILIKEAVRLSQNCGLYQGMKTERTMFRSLFSTEDKAIRTNEFLNGKK